jgi:hypothetical protein
LSYLAFNILILFVGLSLRYLFISIPNSLVVQLGVLSIIGTLTFITFAGLLRDFITSKGKAFSNQILMQQSVNKTHIALWVKLIIGMAFCILLLDFGNLKQVFVDTLLCVIGLSASQTFKYTVIHFLSFWANRVGK